MRWLWILIAALVLIGCDGDDPVGSLGENPESGDEQVVIEEPADGDDASGDNSDGDAGGDGDPTSVQWFFDGDDWISTTAPPECPDPLVMKAPVDLDLVTSILYPGQERSGYFKPHGGFRFDGDGQTNEVDVTAPMEGELYRAAQYLIGGEIQFTVDLIHPCGIMHRFGHIREPSARLMTLFAALPDAAEGDSRTTPFPPGTVIERGELLASAVGFREDENVFVDWGVFDLRERNAASADPAWLENHSIALEAYAVCWFDLLPAADAAAVRNLPAADGQSGRTSDYCE